MLRFQAFDNGGSAADFELTGAYLFGSDGVPLRAEIERVGDVVNCVKRAAGPAGLAILWPVEGVGGVMLETPRLLERDAPYIIPLELARGLMLRIHHKREEWGLHDAAESGALNKSVLAAIDLLVEAMCAETPQKTSELGQKALAEAVRIGEEMTRLHADILLERRKQTAGFSRRVFGCRIDPTDSLAKCSPLVANQVDFACVALDWKAIEPTERAFNWKQCDAWIEWLAKNRIPIKGTNLVNFDARVIPEWMYIWEHDFETIRDLVAEHVRRVVNRYGSYIQVWDVVNGLHNTHRFNFNFEQLMELTRMSTTITKQLAPRSITILDIVEPWGEYYARNQRTIPPMLYVDMAMQSGIQFDAIGLQIMFGADREGMFVRDMFQISALIDRFGNFGRPIHVTAAAVPSKRTVPSDADAPARGFQPGGQWRGEWSDQIQSDWFRQFCEVALARPFVETVTWRDLADSKQSLITTAGLIDASHAPKPVYREFTRLRGEVVPGARAV